MEKININNKNDRIKKIFFLSYLTQDPICVQFGCIQTRLTNPEARRNNESYHFGASSEIRKQRLREGQGSVKSLR